jgi:hypothetical protein
MWMRLEWVWRCGARWARGPKVGFLVLGILALLLPGSSADAVTIETAVTSFTGDDSAARIILDDATAGSGDILVTVEAIVGVADIRGVFFDVGLDVSELAGLSAIGTSVDSFQSGDVIDLGLGSNLHGGGSPCSCDFGVAIGTPGIGMDDFLAVSFTLSHDTLDLTLSMFFEQSVGVRLTSVGPDSWDREGSSKLGGVMPVPEPSTAAMLGLGLAALSLGSRRRWCMNWSGPAASPLP